ncbi:hypothetical protein V6N13_046250 [Hibiscus sabdariffa]
MLVTRLILPWHICGSSKIVRDDKGDASTERQRVLPGQTILAGLPRQVTDLLSWRDNLLPWLGRKSSASAGKSGLAGNMPDSAQICHGWKSPARGVGGKSSAWAGKSGLAGNMPDSAQLCHGRFTNSAPADAIVAALAGSECHQPGTALVQLPIWH